MKIGDKDCEQIIVTKNTTGRLVTANDCKEVIAVISDDDEVIIKNGYEVKLVAASDSEV